jgi:DNA-binding NarL/FixJ family response regulator
MTSLRILLVDDFAPWRRFVFSTLKETLKLQFIFEASNGLEAVQKAQELQPSLIVLDIGLPKLNGIEAARQIRKVTPNSKILFLTEHYSPDMAALALSTGASGYVVKSNAGSELLAAVEAILQGKQFMSARFASHEFAHTPNAQSSLRTTVNADVCGGQVVD